MNSIKKNFIYNSAYQLLNLLIPIVTTPHLSRVLGASGIGVYSYYFSIASYFVLFIMLGLNNYGNREIAKVRDDYSKLSKLFWEIYFFQIFLAILLNLVYLLYSVLYSSNSIISLTMFPFVISAAIDINWFFFGIEQFKITLMRNSIIKVFSTLLIFLIVNSYNDLWIYCLIMSISLLISQMILWGYLFQYISFLKPNLIGIKKHIKPNFFLFFTVISVSVFKIMSKIMLGYLSTREQVGYFELSEKLLIIPLALVTSLGTVMLPRMSNVLTKQPDKIGNMISKSLIFTLFFSSSLCFGLMGILKEFVPFFYGNGYEDCITLLLILLPSCLFMSFANVIRTQYLLPMEMDKAYLFSALLGAGINLFINFLLITKYGAIGTAVGVFFSEVTVCIYQSYMVRKGLPIKSFLTIVTPFVVSGFFMFVILYGINVPINNLFLVILCKIILGIIIYFTLFLVYSKFISNLTLMSIIDDFKEFKNER